jgi:hypothetical protein
MDGSIKRMFHKVPGHFRGRMACARRHIRPSRCESPLGSLLSGGGVRFVKGPYENRRSGEQGDPRCRRFEPRRPTG